MLRNYIGGAVWVKGGSVEVLGGVGCYEGCPAKGTLPLCKSAGLGC